MPLECLSQLCVKVLVEQRGRSCAASLTLAVLFLVELPSYKQQFVVTPSVCEYKVSYAS